MRKMSLSGVHASTKINWLCVTLETSRWVILIFVISVLITSCVCSTRYSTQCIHVQSVLCLHRLSNGGFVMNFPLEMGSITGYSGRRKDTEIFYSFVSFLTPGIIYHCDMTKEELSPTVSDFLHSLIEPCASNFLTCLFIVGIPSN